MSALSGATVTVCLCYSLPCLGENCNRPVMQIRPGVARIAPVTRADSSFEPSGFSVNIEWTNYLCPGCRDAVRSRHISIFQGNLLHDGAVRVRIDVAYRNILLRHAVPLVRTACLAAETAVAVTFPLGVQTAHAASFLRPSRMR